MHKLQVLLIKLFFDNSRFIVGAESSFVYPKPEADLGGAGVGGGGVGDACLRNVT